MEDKEISQLSEFEADYWWNKGRSKILCDLISQHENNSKSLEILDVGCGPGGTSSNFLQFGNVSGTDFSSLALKLAKKKGLTNVVQSSVTKIPFASEKFDVVTVLDVIEHVQEDKAVLDEVWRMLKSNGIIVVTVPAFQFLWSEHDIAASHVRRYNKSTIKNVLNDSRFKILRLSYFVSFVFPYVAFYRLLTKNRIKKEKPELNFVKLPKPINNFLEKIILFENKLLKKIDLPFGVSIVCIAKKPSTTKL